MNLQDRLNTIPFWYHRIELPGGIVTPGWAPVDAAAYRLPERLDGMRVLDVGAWDGYWTFEALRRGAREVVAIDDFSDTMGFNVPRKNWDAFDICAEALGVASRCSRIAMSVYEASEISLGRFDLTLFFGTIYHLRHPLLALDKLSAICDGEIYVESAILDDYSAYRNKFGEGYAGGQIVMEFYPGAEYGRNPSNWWAPTLHCLAAMIASSGWPKVQGWKLQENPKELGYCRGFAKGTRL